MSVVGLVGLPNAGKSSLFNLLTGGNQRIANFPGITTEKKSGNNKELNLEVIDLPGVYTLDASSLDEKVTRDFLLDKDSKEQVDLFILVMDATNLRKSIYLALQLQEIGQKFVLALNMMDIADKRGQSLNLKKLSAHLGGVQIVPLSVARGEGLQSLLKVVEEEIKVQRKSVKVSEDFQRSIKKTEYIKNKLEQVEVILKDTILKKLSPDNFTQRLDGIFLHPFLGPIILLLTLLMMFQLLFTWSDPFMGLIETGFAMLGDVISQALPAGYLQSLLVDGIIAGVGGILVFLPHIVFLFMLIYFIEDFGYLGRVAFSLDYLMRKIGLPGKAVVPLLSSHACAIPGIMSARIIEDERQRLLTMMIAPLTTCSARLPVYTLLIAVIIPSDLQLGPFSFQALTLFGLYLMGILSAFLVAFLTRKKYLPTSPAHLLMELPPYRFPNLRKVLVQSLLKGWVFVKKAGTVILFLSIILWGLISFPGSPKSADKPAIHYSYAAMVGRAVEPVFRPLGFDWKLTTALIPSFAAREVMVAALGTVYAVADEQTDEASLMGSLSLTLQKQYPLATMMALLIWFVFAPQCLSTFGVLKKETGGYRYPLIFMGYTLLLSYVLAALTFFLFK